MSIRTGVLYLAESLPSAETSAARVLVQEKMLLTTENIS